MLVCPILELGSPFEVLSVVIPPGQITPHYLCSSTSNALMDALMDAKLTS